VDAGAADGGMTRILRSPDRFSETVDKEGQTDMFAVMRTYQKIGFDGPLRPDHLPTMEGEENLAPDYDVLGRVFAITTSKA
jgi:mannonate dehydratase